MKKQSLFTILVMLLLAILFNIMHNTTTAQSARGFSTYNGEVWFWTKSIGNPPDYQMIDETHMVKTLTYDQNVPPSSYSGVVVRDYDNVWEGASHDPRIDEPPAVDVHWALTQTQILFSGLGLNSWDNNGAYIIGTVN